MHKVANKQQHILQIYKPLFPPTKLTGTYKAPSVMTIGGRSI